MVYLGAFDALDAFSAAGTTGCSGTPKTCALLWTGPTTNQILSSPAVAYEVVYIGSLDGKFYAFSAAGTTGCSGTPQELHSAVDRNQQQQHDLRLARGGQRDGLRGAVERVRRPLGLQAVAKRSAA